MKDAKGHGSNGRGADDLGSQWGSRAPPARSVGRGADDLGSMWGNMQAAGALAQGHPKSGPVQVHGSMADDLGSAWGRAGGGDRAMQKPQPGDNDDLGSKW